jgi:hypothetical protein
MNAILDKRISEVKRDKNATKPHFTYYYVSDVVDSTVCWHDGEKMQLWMSARDIITHGLAYYFDGIFITDVGDMQHFAFKDERCLEFAKLVKKANEEITKRFGLSKKFKENEEEKQRSLQDRIGTAFYNKTPIHVGVDERGNLTVSGDMVTLASANEESEHQTQSYHISTDGQVTSFIYTNMNGCFVIKRSSNTILQASLLFFLVLFEFLRQSESFGDLFVSFFNKLRELEAPLVLESKMLHVTNISNKDSIEIICQTMRYDVSCRHPQLHFFSIMPTYRRINDIAHIIVCEMRFRRIFVTFHFTDSLVKDCIHDFANILRVV